MTYSIWTILNSKKFMYTNTSRVKLKTTSYIHSLLHNVKRLSSLQKKKKFINECSKHIFCSLTEFIIRTLSNFVPIYWKLLLMHLIGCIHQRKLIIIDVVSHIILCTAWTYNLYFEYFCFANAANTG